MKKKIEKSYTNAELLNELYNLGFRYITEGDYVTLDTFDPWSGMPNVACNLYAFDNKEEAEAFAEKQIWVFNDKIHAKVKEIPPHTKTWGEIAEEEAKAKAERKAKAEAKQLEKAKAMGLTLEKYKEEENRKRKIKKVKKEIATLEEELAEKKAYLKKLENQ
jgi:uncharacterized radical SAM superfamily Fe-S cluster-containing enzyme